MKTKLFIFFLAIFAVASFGFLDSKIVFATESADTICYVSLGDSIAVGYNLPNYVKDVSDANGETAGQFVQDSYAFKFKTMLENKFGANNVKSTTYATSGDAGADLLEKLENETIQSTLKNADIVTICIGANDILGPALNNIDGYILKDTASGSVSVVQMENELSAGLQKFCGDDNTQGVFDKILNKLYEINADAEYIFTNVYNPYKVFALPTSLSSFVSYTNFSEEKINKMGEITNVYLAGGKNSQAQTILGLNQILQSKLQDFDKDNFVLVDTYSSFDAHTLTTTPKYNELVYATLTKDATIDLTELMNGGADVIMAKADPHPTEKGHDLLYNAFQTFFADNICTLTLDYNGATINNKTSETQLCFKNSKPNLPQLSIADKVFGGWYTSNGTKWTETSVITADTVLYAKWLYSITYNLDGGTNNIDNPNGYASGETVVLKNPTKEGYTFAGWFTESGFVNSKQTIQGDENSNITLFAKWTPTEYTITYMLDGGVNGDNPLVYTIESPEITLNNPTKQGYVFEGWFTDSSLQTPISKIPTGTIGDLTIYAKWRKVWTVTFDANGGTDCEPVYVENGQKITEIPQTSKMNAYQNIFVGWYYNNQLWDFENGTVTQDIVLVAKWVGPVCTTENLHQTIDNTQPIVFVIDLEDASFSWYVDEVLQQGKTENTFSFTPSQVGEYSIHCVVNGTISEIFTIVVEYAVPNKIVLNQPQKDGNNYLFSIQNGELYDPEKIVWYKSTAIKDGQSSLIGTGATCEVKLTSTCYVYAVYNNEIISDKTEIKIEIENKDSENKSDNGILLVVIITVVAVAIPAVIIIIKHQKSKKKQQKNTTDSNDQQS